MTWAIILYLFLVSGIGCAQAKSKLVIWSPIHTFREQGFQASVREFERRHPGVQVEVLSMGAGGSNPQKLMTAIVGNVPPDVINQNRNTIGDWAARDTFMALDGLIARDRNKPDGIRSEEYYPACWNEVIYKSKLYAVADSTDDRTLYYNRRLFREAGLDPNKPPRTWDELLQYATMVNREDLTLYENPWASVWNKTHETGHFLQQSRMMFLMERGQELWLAPFVTSNWMKDDEVVSIKNAPSFFGPVSYKITSHAANGYIEAIVTPPTRQAPKSLVIRRRHPDGRPMRAVTVNGAAWKDFDSQKEIVRLKPTKSAITVRANY